MMTTDVGRQRMQRMRTFSIEHSVCYDVQEQAFSFVSMGAYYGTVN